MLAFVRRTPVVLYGAGNVNGPCGATRRQKLTDLRGREARAQRGRARFFHQPSARRRRRTDNELRIAN